MSSLAAGRSGSGAERARRQPIGAVRRVAGARAHAAIGCWNIKYHWNTWRPITAIREAASDGNRATKADPTRTPLFDPSTPVASPPALVTSDTTRTFHRFSDALRENIDARVWAGIHFRTADIEGARLGEKVARYLHKHYLQPAAPAKRVFVPTSRRPRSAVSGRRRTALAVADRGGTR
jgi:hypothetical protein